MSLGFQTWKDVIEILIVPVSLALISILWPELQSASRHRKFRRLILRELREMTPFPQDAQKGKDWYEHQRKDFIHQALFDTPSESEDIILSLSPDMVYDVSQLWSALKNRDAEQWLHFLYKLSTPKYDKKGEIKKTYQQWDSLINQYKKIGSAEKARSSGPRHRTT
jgi:hypothetical protein